MSQEIGSGVKAAVLRLAFKARAAVPDDPMIVMQVATLLPREGSGA